MITVKTNINKVVEVTVKQLKSLADNDRMLRTCATTVLGMMKNRIHEKGLNAAGAKIGTYSKAYMRFRTGNYGNASKVSKGKNKGKLKDAGVFSKGANKGQARMRFNRTGDSTVVASLTRQMENDMKVISLSGGYGIGFSNKHNYDKSQWVEGTYKMKGKIFALSAEEKQAVIDIAQKFTDAVLR